MLINVIPNNLLFIPICVMAIPNNLKELQGFLGFVNFYRKFIINSSALAKPLHELTWKDIWYKFTKLQMDAFNLIKEVITTAPILHHFDPAYLIKVETDASDYTLGAVISQTDSAGVSRPVAFKRHKQRNI